MTLIDLLDYPDLRYTTLSNADIIDRGLNDGALPCGQYAFALARDRAVYLARDPLGCNKLFLGHDRTGNLLVSNRIARLWRSGVPLSAIGSCPPGHVLEVSSEGVRDLGGADCSSMAPDREFSVTGFQAMSRAALDRAFAWLAGRFKGCQFVVCLSGGLDSSVVASYAAARLPGVIAASFTYLDAGDLRRCARGVPLDQLASGSDDSRAATRIASALGITLLPVVRPREAVASVVPHAVRLCQDWRDFNVHCATVNVFLAQDLRAAFPNEHVVVLTGDPMNEYVSDYKEEWVDGTVYYKIPRIPADKRRKYLVRGLDAGDREIGVFWSYGLMVCQPFAALARHYMRIPASLLNEPDLKSRLNGVFLAPQVVALVNRSKSRAQVGGEDMGTLGLYHQLGIGDPELRQAWQDQFPGESPAACHDLIQFGRYRVPRCRPVG